MEKMTVKAAPGVKVPREENARKYIEQDPVTVERSAYYLRQHAAGDLIIIDVKNSEKVSADDAKATTKKNVSPEVNGGQS